jgi:hypothetical protein
VIKVGDVFYMRYTGGTTNANWKLGAAWALDPYGPWHRPAALEIPLGPAGSWDDDRLVRGAIHFHNGKWYSPYTGNDGSAYRGGIASADPAPTPNDLVFETRTSANGTSWYPWTPLGSGGQIQSLPDTYIQYRVTLTAAPDGTSPTLRRVTINYVESPVGVAADRPVAALTGGGVTLTWSYDPQAADGFHVYRSRDGGPSERLTQEPLANRDGRIVFIDIAAGVSEGAVLRYSYALLRDGAEVGRGVEVMIVYAAAGAPRALALRGIHPNPFNPSTTVQFDLPRAGRANLTVYSSSGRLVRVLLDSALPAASHSVIWDGRDAVGRPVASGVYFARLTFNDEVRVSKMTLAK